ncbi:MAG TPA: phosphopentomutase [Candidatus Gastranaerophilales bacterium]|nr:phosphopentomutase [Candidatus Gastranaerophilales bacterium]
MKRAIILVIDGLGAGALPDAAKYGDIPQCNTLANVAKLSGGLNLPNLEKLGLGNIMEIQGVKPCEMPLASFGTMKEKSAGKDTTTGHWEIAGLILETPFKTYPHGFPETIINEFIKRTGCGGILGNYPASGTAVISELGDEHVKTGKPIIYTSADSVFQIACHVEAVPLEILYKWCEIARELLNENAEEHNVCRVIARPFEGKSGIYKRISAARRDYSVKPTKATILNEIEQNNGTVIGIGKIEDIFVKSGITHAIHTGSNKEGLELALKALNNDLAGEKHLLVYKEIENPEISLIFNNLVDTDMLFGHRNDVKGFAAALEEIDSYLEKIIPLITKDDLLIITADHGCDPTVCGTDHTREKVPVLVYNPYLEAKNLGERETFADIALTVSKWLNISCENAGDSLI